MHIQLTDFGSSVIIDNDECKNLYPDDSNLFIYLALPHKSETNGEKKSLKRTNSFVGTAQFVAPEVLKRGTIHIGFVQRFF